MTMKRLMIMAAMLTVLACGDDSSSGDDSDDTTDQKPTKDAGNRDAKVDARSSSSDDDDTDDSDDDTSDDVKDAGKVDASKGDAGTGNECLLLNYASFGKAFEVKYCASCHAASVKGATARMAAPDDEVFDTLAQIKAAKAELKDQVVVMKAMPFPLKGIPLPTDAERVQFGKFLDCGPN